MTGAVGQRPREWCIFALLSATSVLLGAAADARAQGVENRSARIKAALVYHILEFVKFGDPKMADVSKPLKVCIGDATPFGNTVREVLGGVKSQGRPIELHPEVPGAPVTGSAGCRVIVVGSDSTQLELLRQAKGKPVLTICERVQIEWGACAIQIYDESNRARIAVDRQLASRAGIKVSSELLDVARVGP